MPWYETPKGDPFFSVNLQLLPIPGDGLGKAIVAIAILYDFDTLTKISGSAKEKLVPVNNSLLFWHNVFCSKIFRPTDTELAHAC